LLAGSAVVVRYAAETFVVHRHSDRVALAQGENEPVHHHLLHLVFVLLGVAAFMLFTSAFVGWSTALWIAAGLAALQSILSRWGRHFPKIPGLQWLAPVGVAKFILVLCVGKIIAGILKSQIHDPVTLLRISLVALALPSLVLLASKTMSENHKKFPMTWPLRAAGTGAVVLGFLVITKVITI